jgi:hypothetical protein
MNDSAAAAPAAAAGGGGKYDVGDTVILMNGSLCYEAEVLQVQPVGEAPTAKAKGGRAKSGADEVSYLIRYTKWQRRPEEWVNESFIYPWTEARNKNATNRPPRKAMWAEHKPIVEPTGSNAMQVLADAGESGEGGEGGEAEGSGRRSGRARAAAAAAAEASAEEDAGAGRKRQRRPTEKARVESDAGSGRGGGGRSTTPISEGAEGDAAAALMMGGQAHGDDDADALMGLMKGSAMDAEGEGEGEDDEDDEDDDEGEEGEEEEEEEEDGEEEEEDDKDGGSDDEDDEDAEDAADDLKLILAQQKKNKEEEPKDVLKSPRADKRIDGVAHHRRKGVPMKSFKPLAVISLDGDANSEADGSKADGEAGGPNGGANKNAEDGDSGVLFKPTAGAVRRRKPACPSKSLV